MSNILWFLLILTKTGFCKIYTVDKLTIEKFKLKKNDQIFFNNSKLDLFVHVQSHYFYGSLTVNVLNESTKQTTEFHLTQGDNLRFTSSVITITYTGSTKLCSLQIWYVPSNKCTENSIYYSGLTKSILNLNGIYKNFDACYFFDLSDDPKIISTNPSKDLVAYLLYVANNSYIEKRIDSSLEDFPISKSFVFNTKNQIIQIDYQFSVTTKSAFFDFTQKDSIFQTCVLDNCKEPISSMPKFQNDRSLKWWIWFILSTFAILLLGIALVITLFPKKPEESLFFSSKQLVSVG